MKKQFPLLALFLLLGLTSTPGQTDNSNPKDVAQKFLDLYAEGNWFDACKFYATQNSDEQLSFMLKKMETDDNYVDEGKCSFKVDTCIIGEDKSTAECFYVKTCTALKKPVKHQLNLILQGNKWLVDYLWRRERFL
jgi:hypothetical protein